jgi:hypothetical protein
MVLSSQLNQRKEYKAYYQSSQLMRTCIQYCPYTET